LVPAAFEVTVGPRPAVVSTAVHAGHDVRRDLIGLMALDDVTRRREEDPYTDRLIRDLGTQFVVHRSRFEVDLNRPRTKAVYIERDDAWGLEVWNDELPRSCVRDSLAIYDGFYRELAAHLDRITAVGPCLVLDVHSYNHRRGGPDEAAGSVAENPEVNVGTGWLDRARWALVVDRFMGYLRDDNVDGHRLDVRENVRFKGGHLSHWIASRYPRTACVMAIEFKKTFMDEWTGVADDDRIAKLGAGLRVAVDRTVEALVPVQG
jgi:N-formylglutamate deformylase